MTIYTDNIHLITDQENQEELHAFAKKMGLKREWFQDSNPAHPHYDLTTKRAANRAIRHGAKMISPQELVTKLKEAQSGTVDTGNSE